LTPLKSRWTVPLSMNGAIVTIAPYGWPMVYHSANSRWRYVIVASLYTENRDMQILKHSYLLWDSSPNDLEINLSYPKSHMRSRQHLMGLSYQREQAKVAEDLGASPFKSDLVD
jgi:hypothetical protein